MEKGLVLAWKRYVELFGEPPHGTEKQMAALLSLIPSSKDLADDGPEIGLIIFFHSHPEGSQYPLQELCCVGQSTNVVAH